METEINRECSCCCPSFWNTLYDTFLKLNFTRRTKDVAFAEVLIPVVTGTTPRGAENFANIEMSKITAWAKSNKRSLNEKKCKPMLMCRRKRKEGEEMNVFVKQQSYGTGNQNEIFRNTYR